MEPGLAKSWTPHSPHQDPSPSSRVPFFFFLKTTPPLPLASPHCSLLLITVSAWVCTRWALSKQILPTPPHPPCFVYCGGGSRGSGTRFLLFQHMNRRRGVASWRITSPWTSLSTEWTVRTLWSVTWSKKKTRRVSGCKSLGAICLVCLFEERPS